MKGKLFLMALFVIITNQLVSGQSEQTYKPYVLQLYENNEIKTFVLESFNYTITRRLNDSIPSKEHAQYIYFNITINDQNDDIITNWIADPGISKKGKISVRNSKTGKTIKEFSFEDAYVDNTSESFYNSYNSYSDTFISSVNLSITCNKFSINNIQIKNLKPYSFQY